SAPQTFRSPPEMLRCRTIHSPHLAIRPIWKSRTCEDSRDHARAIPGSRMIADASHAYDGNARISEDGHTNPAQDLDTVHAPTQWRPSTSCAQGLQRQTTGALRAQEPPAVLVSFSLASWPASIRVT